MVIVALMVLFAGSHAQEPRGWERNFREIPEFCIMVVGNLTGDQDIEGSLEGIRLALLDFALLYNFPLQDCRASSDPLRAALNVMLARSGNAVVVSFTVHVVDPLYYLPVVWWNYQLLTNYAPERSDRLVQTVRLNFEVLVMAWRRAQ